MRTSRVRDKLVRSPTVANLNRSSKLCDPETIDMASIRHKSVLYHSSKVIYDSYGSGGSALVFIHGWSCSAALYYAQTPLFHRHHSITIDLPGHGRSDAPKIEYSLEFMARAVIEVLNTENISSAILIGHSMGGPVSTMVLRLKPQAVRGVIYVDSFFHLPETYMTVSQRQELAAAHADDEKFRSFLAPFATPKLSSGDWERIIDIMTSTALHVRTNATTTVVQPHAWRYKEIYEVPALHLVTPMFEDFDRHWLHHIPRLETVVWPDNGHFLFMEEPQRFNAAVEEFLDRLELFRT